MVGQNQTFAEGASINRPLLFTSENYPFWKVRMQIFLESVDGGIGDVVLNGPFVPVKIVNDVQEPKPLSQWTADENRRAQYDVNRRAQYDVKAKI